MGAQVGQAAGNATQNIAPCLLRHTHKREWNPRLHGPKPLVRSRKTTPTLSASRALHAVVLSDIAFYIKHEYDHKYPGSGKATEGVYHCAVGRHFASARLGFTIARTSPCLPCWAGSSLKEFMRAIEEMPAHCCCMRCCTIFSGRRPTNAAVVGIFRGYTYRGVHHCIVHG
jgi:hypothetical protein